MDPAIVTMEEVRSVRDSLGVRGTQRTLGPFGWSQAPAMLSRFSDQMNSELYLVLDTGRSRGHQSPTSDQFLCTHDIFDAKLRRKDSAGVFHTHRANQRTERAARLRQTRPCHAKP